MRWTLDWSMLLLLLACAVAAHTAESCDPIKTFADGKTPTREIFISPSGDNETGDGTKEKPYATLPKALQEVRAGQAVRLLPGEYRGGLSVVDLAGSDAEPIWIGGAPGMERPVIRGGGGGMHLSRVRYLVLENLEVAGATGNGVNCDDGGAYGNVNATRFVVFRNLFIHDIGTGKNNDGLKVSGVNDFWVLDCEFAKISLGGSAIDHVGCHRGLIARSTFTDCGNGVQCKGGSRDIEIRWNRFIRAGGRAINIGGSTGFQFFRPVLSKEFLNYEAFNIRVFANTFEGSDAPVAFVGAANSIVANNTIIDPTRWVVRILQETTSKDGYEFLPCGSNEFSNNIVWYRRGGISTHVNVGSHVEAGSFTFANNLWYAHDAPARSRPELPVKEENGMVGQDPKFQDVAGRNFRVEPDSPAVGNGKKITGLKADAAERCYAERPTIGAFESKFPSKTN